MEEAAVVRIDQMVHGYDRGHRELLTSLALEDRSRATILVFSDLLATSVLPENSSYLTSYPLRSSSRHVVAKTWGAGPSYRPGSVWTHSLVLDYQALALIPDLVALDQLFRHPLLSSRSAFTQPIEFEVTRTSISSSVSPERALSALAKIYGDGLDREVVLESMPGEDDQILALALWRQMWPALRRDFAFLTCETDRKINLEAGCLLRFTNSSLFARAEHRAMHARKGHFILLDDLSVSGGTPLRNFLARYAIEGSVPRALAVRLAEQFASPNKIDFDNVRALAQNDLLPRLMKDVAVQMFNSTVLEEEFIELVFNLKNENLGLDLQPIVRRSNLLSDMDFRRLLAAAQPSSDGEFGALLLYEIFKNASIDRLVAASSVIDRTKLLSIRPEAARFIDFWPFADQERAELLSEVSGYLAFNDAIAMFSSTLGPYTAATLLQSCKDDDSKEVVALLSFANEVVRTMAAGWFAVSTDRLEAMADEISRVPVTVADELARTYLQGEKALTRELISVWQQLLKKVECSEKRTYLSMMTFLCALYSSDDTSLNLGSQVYDSLLASTSDGKYSRDMRAALRGVFGDYSSLPRALAVAAVKRWPLSAKNAGALDISTCSSHLDILVREVVVQQGRNKLSAAVRDGRLSVVAEERARKYLTEFYSRKFWPFW